MRSLVLEDDYLCGLLIQEFFAMLKWKTHVIADGDMLFPMMEEHKYALVVIDHVVPGKRGLDLVPLIKERYHLPIIVATGVPDGLPFLSAGADLYFEKPFGMEEFQRGVLSLT
jgi:DNA-binding response OmpR family regulator